MAGVGAAHRSDASRVPALKPSEIHAIDGSKTTRPEMVSEGTETGDNPNNSETDQSSVLDRRLHSSLAVQTSLPTSRTPIKPLSSLGSPERGRQPTSPHRARQPHTVSPGLPFQLSPRVHSPASSQIFERSVQEDIAPAQASPSIPSHIITENHIPPILDASSEALTDDKLDPDSVEIVTHNYHQPASLPVTGACIEHPLPHGWNDETLSNIHTEADDSVSNNGTLDPTDIKRLSFVSFADLVHGEQAAESTEYRSNRNSMHMVGAQIPNFSPLGNRNRSCSPLHSPTSSRGLGTSPPTSMSSPPRTFDASPHRAARIPGSPGLGNCSPPPCLGGELNVETMRQALRRTESGDLGGWRSQPMSATDGGDHALDREQPSN